ncbi:uncharacterized protein LOC134333724 [Trichomycterus rosablanca]|uniref:uncharacterized protein LOC134333724 n=1 Tax=Trichomycterus rosablanca TaxID=2290929 RepID=UPI002F35F460
MEHGGFIDQTKVAELPTNLEEDSSETKPVANGCAGDKPEQTPSSPVLNIPEENSFSSESSLSLDVKKVGFNLDLDLIGDSVLANEASSEPKDQEQSENNSNDSNTDNDPVDFFTEINLDEPQ